jgi:adenylate cyclase
VKRASRPVLGAALAALLVGGLSAVVRDEGPGRNTLELLERWTVDWRFRLRGARAPAPEVALVVFDDRTAEEAGPLFERRAGWAKVIAAAKAAGAKVIGVDAMFDVPERLLGEGLQARVEAWRATREGGAEAGPAEQLLGDVATELDGDAVLADAVRAAGNVVLIIYTGERETTLEPGALGRARYAQSTPGVVPPPEARAIIGSIPDINAAAKALGFATVSEDATRTVRRLLFARTVEGGVYLPFTVPVVGLARGVGRGEWAYLGPEQAVQLGEARFPLQDDGAWLDYVGPRGTFPTYSAMDLVAGTVPPGALDGKVVLLGITRLGYDEARTPFESMPGVEVQATAIDNLLRGRALTRSRRSVDLALTAGLGLLAAALFFARRLRVQLLGGGALVAGWSGVTLVAFTAQALWLPWVMPLASLLASLAVGLVLSYASEALQRQQLKKAFGHYVGDDVLEELVAHPEKLQLGGEKRTLTVFFSDIRDFTTLSEKLSPVELVAFLNTYLSPMTRAVLREGGLLDKYIGDAVMGVFGAPVPREAHADMALRCVLEMHRELDALNAGPLQRFGLTVAIGVGVNTGDMVVGNMGSAERFDYTVAGDAVNLASRLEGLSKTYGVFCLVGEGTVRAASRDFTFRELDLVQVKGKHEAVAVYELLAGPGRTVQARAALDRWSEGLAAFRAGKLTEARAAFGAFADGNPGDLAVQRYLARLAELPEQAPEGFSAVTAFKTK